MFKREEEIKKTEPFIDEIETVIGPSVKVEGDFNAAGNVVVEGVVLGSIKTEKNLRVGKDAKIFASVTAGSAIIAGEVQGNTKIKNNLEMTETSKLFGDVKAKTLSMTTGATLIGKCVIGEDRRSKKEDGLKTAREKEEKEEKAKAN